MISQLTKALYDVMSSPDFSKDCISKGQLDSKDWLITEASKLNLKFGTVFLCAGWYATLATLLLESNISIDKIRSFDIDPSCAKIADTINRPWVMDNWKFKAITDDILSINYDTHSWQVWSNANNRMSKPIVDSPTTIINTSCEHIANFSNWYNKIPARKLVILQTNNYKEIIDHVNCSDSLDEFTKITPMSSVLFSGELVLEKYTRYMRIGIK